MDNWTTREEQGRLIRDKIIQKIGNFSIEQLTREINACMNIDPPITSATIHNLINGSTKPNIWAIIGICKFLKIDYDEILPAANSNHDLKDKGYMNHYYGFMYLRNNKFQNPVEIELIISSNMDAPTAKLKYTNKAYDISYSFSGTPKYNNSKELIYIMFTLDEISGKDRDKENHSYYHFYFEYKNYDGKMNYRKGFCVCQSKNNDSPMIMNFCIFDRKLPVEEFVENMQGLLLFGNDEFIIQKDKADAILSNESDDVNQFFNKQGILATVKEKQVYIINEKNITSTLQNTLPNYKELTDEAYKCLLKLKTESFSSKRISYENSQYELIKRIMNEYPHTMENYPNYTGNESTQTQ